MNFSRVHNVLILLMRFIPSIKYNRQPGADMQIVQGCLYVCLILDIAGCAAISPRYQLAAAPLMSAPDTPSPATFAPADSTAQAAGGAASVGGASHVAGTADGLSKIQVVHLLVQDSEQKCFTFINSLFAQTAGSSFILDMLSTISSALATVFTPLTVTHSLSAGSTIFGAAKTSVSSEYLNTLSISHISQSIQATYQTDINGYLKYLDNLDPTEQQNIDVFAERSKILAYHNECSLAWAEGTISSSLTPTNQPGSTQAAAAISFTYKVPTPPQASPTALAKDLAVAISADPTFKSAGVSAAPVANGTISFAMKKSFQLNVVTSPSAKETATITNDSSPITLTIGGVPTAGDSITVSGTPPAPSSSTPAAPQPASSTTARQPSAAPAGPALGKIM